MHCHGLRHTAAKEWHLRGVPVAVIQRLLGHAALSTTAVYLSTLSAKDTQDALDLIEEW